jgi:hypothetical protein
MALRWRTCLIKCHLDMNLFAGRIHIPVRPLRVRVPDSTRCESDAKAGSGPGHCGGDSGRPEGHPDIDAHHALAPRSSRRGAYARRGALFDAFRRHYGKPSPVLVWKADTRTMNATVPRELIDEAVESDPARAAAEYGVDDERRSPRWLTLAHRAWRDQETSCSFHTVPCIHRYRFYLKRLVAQRPCVEGYSPRAQPHSWLEPQHSS